MNPMDQELLDASEGYPEPVIAESQPEPVIVEPLPLQNVEAQLTLPGIEPAPEAQLTLLPGIEPERQGLFHRAHPILDQIETLSSLIAQDLGHQLRDLVAKIRPLL